MKFENQITAIDCFGDYCAVANSLAQVVSLIRLEDYEVRESCKVGGITCDIVLN